MPSPLPRPWTPVLDGSAAIRASVALSTLCETLRDPPPLWTPPGMPAQARPALEASLSRGVCALALFEAYAARAGQDYPDGPGARWTDRAATLLAEVRMGPGLYAGFTGVAFTLQHLAGLGLLGLDEDDLDPIDAALHAYLAAPPADAEWDLVGGLVGLGVYALERGPAASGLLARVVHLLAARAVRDADGARWWTPPRHVAPAALPASAAGHADLGLAHGGSGVIVLLARAAARGVAEAQPLLDDAVRWLLAQRQDREGLLAFPSWITLDGRRWPARLGWCYGDLGVACALAVAAGCVQREDWRAEAEQIALRTVGFSQGIHDAGLCHGAAGAGLMYARLYQATGAPALLDAARRWTDAALDHQRPGEGIAGFSTIYVDEQGATSRPLDSGLLTGATGIGLALAAAVSPVAPDWDRAMLLSAPEVG